MRPMSQSKTCPCFFEKKKVPGAHTSETEREPAQSRRRGRQAGEPTAKANGTANETASNLRARPQVLVTGPVFRAPSAHTAITFASPVMLSCGRWARVALRTRLSAAQGSTSRAAVVQRPLKAMPQAVLSYHPSPRHSISEDVATLCNQGELAIMDTPSLNRPGDRSHALVASIFARELGSLSHLAGRVDIAALMGYEDVRARP